MYVGTQTHYCFFPSKYLEKKLILMQKKNPNNFVYGTFCYRHIMDGVTVLEVKIWIYQSESNSWVYFYIQLTLVISNSMGPWKKFESTVVRLKRSYEDTGSMVCLTTKGIQLERNFEELKPASHVPILGTILNIRCFCCCFFLSVKFFESCETTDNF
jgi:hypothetical protein